MRSGPTALGSFLLCLATSSSAFSQSNTVGAPSTQGSQQAAAPGETAFQSASAPTIASPNLRDDSSRHFSIISPTQPLSPVVSCGHIIVYRAYPQPNPAALIPAPKDSADNASVLRAMPPCAEDIRNLSAELPLHPYRDPRSFIPPPQPRFKPVTPSAP